MKRVFVLLGLACLLSACDRGGRERGGSSDPGLGTGRGSTNVGLAPGSGRIDQGGGVTEGDSPAKPRSAVTGTDTYERPGKTVQPSTNAYTR